MTLVMLIPEHQALLDHWRSIGTDGKPPPRSAFDLAKIEHLSGSLFMLEPVPSDWIVRLWGHDLVSLFDFDLTNTPFLERTCCGEYVTTRREALLGASKNQTPVAVYSTLCWESRTLLIAEELYLPLAPVSDDGQPAPILGSLRPVKPGVLQATRNKRFIGWRPELVANLDRDHSGIRPASSVQSLASWSSTS